MRLYFGGFLFIIMFLTGCTKLGPDFSGIKNAPKLPHSWQQENNVSQELSQWWKLFNDPVLEKLIKRAYEENLDLQTAGIRILQARAALGISESMIYPQVQTLSGNLATSYKRSTSLNSAGLNFDVGWEIDFWGKYARDIEASQARLYLSVASYRQILSTLIAEVARNYINYKTAQQRILYAQRNIAIQERVAQMTQVQFNSGNVSELDMQQARTQLYITKSVLPGIELAKIESRNALSVLLAMTHKQTDELLGDLHVKSLTLSSKTKVLQLDEDIEHFFTDELIPVAVFDPYKKIDASLLQRRPDIKVAEANARIASANIGKTQTLLYPSFTLFGNIGYSASDLGGSWISASDAIGVSIGPSFSWNIFQYGRIKNQIRIADAEFEAAVFGYNKTVLEAIREVDNALNGYILTNKQLKESKKALQANLRAFNLSAVQYNNGLVTYQRLLSTVERLTAIQDSYAQLRGLTSINAILLYKALGGGWEISLGKSYISKQTKKRIQDRGTNWGKYLDKNATTFPKRIRYE